MDILNDYCRESFKLVTWIQLFLSVKDSSPIYIEGADRCNQFSGILKALHAPILLLASEGTWQNQLEKTLKAYQCLASVFNKHGKMSSIILSGISELTSSLIKRSRYGDNVLDGLDINNAEGGSIPAISKTAGLTYSRSRLINLQRPDERPLLDYVPA